MQVHNFHNHNFGGGGYHDDGTYDGYDQYGQYEEGEYIEGYSGYEDGQYELMPEAMGYNNQAAAGEDQGGVEYNDRDRDRDRDRRRHRDRRRDRRDKDGRRHRDRDRDRDKDRGRDRRERDRSAHRSDDDRYDDEGNSNDSYARSDRSTDDRAGEKWMTDTPTNTVLLRGMPPYIEEKDIRAELMMCQLPVKDVRLMRRSTGSSRGFAFVEFQTIPDAQRWMDRYQGQLMIQNELVASMHYSTPKSGSEKGPIHKTDWTCSKCGVHNFKRRDQCFKCNLSREESERKQEADGFDQVGTNPCNTLVFRGLDALTTEDSIIKALGQISYTCIKNIQIIRDEATNTSRGYGFMELSSITEATKLLDQIIRSPLEVDGKQLMVAYAKNIFSTAMATLATSQSANYDYSQQSAYYNSTYYQGQEPSTSTQYYEGQQNYDYTQWYSDPNYQQGGASTQTDSTNAAAAVAQAAIAQANAAKHSQAQKQKVDKKSDEQKPAQTTAATTATATASAAQSSEYPVYPAPDVSTYQYDETSGYYYDPLTTLYYDANSQYYYNSTTQQFLYWDAERSTYLPAPTDVQPLAQIDDGNPEKKKKEEKKEKVKIAKKIAKDMEKWAQTMNKQKDALKGIKSINIMTAQKREEARESAAADAGYAILEKSAKGSLDDKKLMPPPPLVGGKISSPAQQGGSKPGLVASYGGDSDDEEGGGGEDDGDLSSGGGVDESKLTDWSNLACLLCKRQFKTREVLIKHQQVSDLHKQNLENLYRSKGLSPSAASSGGEGNNFQYRDRAKERREKYGIPPPPEPRRKERPDAPVPYEEPTKAGIGGDNIGNKLLQKMGWQAGKGLGKKEQGIVNPVEAQRRTQAAGLGMRGANYGAMAGDSYKESLKKTMYARYHETE